MSSGLSYPACVSCEGCAALSLPSPCGRPYRLGVLWSDLTPHAPSDSLLFVGIPYLPLQEAMGSPRFRGISVPACRAPRPRQALQDLTANDPFVLASGKTTPSPPALMTVTRLTGFREVHAPLRPTGFSVYASDISFVALHCVTSISATLDTGGWLGLNRWGLAPHKRCQA